MWADKSCSTSDPQSIEIASSCRLKIGARLPPSIAGLQCLELPFRVFHLALGLGFRDESLGLRVRLRVESLRLRVEGSVQRRNHIGVT